MLSEQRKYQKDFEKRLEKTWKEPIDLLESMIRISTEAVQDKEKRNSKRTEEFKKSALIQIHARGLQIATEILTLIKGGYADGANARWRSLLELSVISFFLRDNEDEISLRYLEFDTVKKLKEASDFQRYHQLLGEDPLEKKNSGRSEKRNIQSNFKIWKRVCKFRIWMDSSKHYQKTNI